MRYYHDLCLVCSESNLVLEPGKGGSPEEFGVTCPICQMTTPIDEETYLNIIILVEGEGEEEGEE